MQTRTRRQFLGNVGQGMLVASLGPSLAGSLGAMPSLVGSEDVAFGDLERLVGLLRDTPLKKLQPKLVAELKAGTSLQSLVAAGALCNAQSFGGTDYEGYHCFMAMEPAFAMAGLLPAEEQPLPVLKVLYRSARRMHGIGGGKRPKAVEAALLHSESKTAQRLLACTRDCDMEGAEKTFASVCATGNLERAFDELQCIVQDDFNVHRTVLAWRAWDMLRLAGKDRAHALLRQSVRYCVDEEQIRVRKRRKEPKLRRVLPRLLDQHKLVGRELGSKHPGDAWVRELSELVMRKGREQAADAVAAALADGVDPEVIGEAISIAANDLILHDPGDRRRRNGVHGASVGVHASDAANAWRNIARVVPRDTRAASLVVAGYHTAGQSYRVNGAPIPYAEKSDKLAKKSPKHLLGAAHTAILQRDQVGVCAAIDRYCKTGGPAKPVFDMMLRFGVSEDGALHAEKYFKAAREEYGRTRPAFRDRRLVALARVTASAYGEPAPGLDEAKRLLGV